MKYTDPSGYFFSGLKKWFSKHRKSIITAIASAIAIATGQYYALNFILKGALVGFVAGATGTLEVCLALLQQDLPMVLEI